MPREASPRPRLRGPRQAAAVGPARRPRERAAQRPTRRCPAAWYPGRPTFDDGGGNIQWPKTKNNGNGDTPCTASVVFADPKLGALADNGGPTETMALPAGSPAIDVGKNCPQYDQRGEPRVGACDSGAYEYQP